MSYQVEFHMELPTGSVVRRSELPSLPSIGSKVMLGLARGMAGTVRSVILYVNSSDDALYLVHLTPLDTPLSTS